MCQRSGEGRHTYIYTKFTGNTSSEMEGVMCTVKPLILASIIFSDFTTYILASIKVSISKNGHVLLCNTINFLADIKVSDIYPIANFAHIYGTLTLMFLQYLWVYEPVCGCGLQ